MPQKTRAEVTVTPLTVQPGQALPRPEFQYAPKDRRTRNLIAHEERLAQFVGEGLDQYGMSYEDPLGAMSRDRKELRVVTRELDKRAASGDALAAGRRPVEKIKEEAWAARYRGARTATRQGESESRSVKNAKALVVEFREQVREGGKKSCPRAVAVHALVRRSKPTQDEVSAVVANARPWGATDAQMKAIGDMIQQHGLEVR